MIRKLFFNTRTKQKLIFLLATAAAFLFVFGFSSCKSNSSPHKFTIWTDREEIVSYTELFNSLHDDVKAVVIYKQHLSRSLPPARDEEKPDLLIGSYLKTENMRRFFRKLDSVFSTDAIDPQIFYTSLLEYGRANNAQYLLPVSFNLPVVIFSVKNEYLVPQQLFIEIDEIRDTASEFNEKNSSGFYVKMGFSPSWDAEFIYTVAKMNGLDFAEKRGSFNWNSHNLSRTVNYIKMWTEENNTSTEAEQDFAFKYLYTPKYRQVSSSRCLYAYATAKDVFGATFPDDLDFRWLTKSGTLFAEDDFATLGIYKGARNPDGARLFIIWLLNEDSQRKILERKTSMRLDTETFGIAAGFSSLKSVNEQILPIYYKNLLGNIPQQSAILPPSTFPARWESLKERVIIPYLTEAVKTTQSKNFKTIEDLLKTWKNQFD